jgi:hypothetical protein
MMIQNYLLSHLGDDLIEAFPLSIQLLSSALIENFPVSTKDFELNTLNQEEREQTIPLINKMKQALKLMQLKTILHIAANSFSFPIKTKDNGREERVYDCKIVPIYHRVR